MSKLQHKVYSYACKFMVFTRQESFFFRKGFSVIKVYFSTYSACVFYQLFQCFINTVKLFRETLPVAPTMRLANMLQRENFSISAQERHSSIVSSGRLREVKTIENFKQSSLKVVVYEWSLVAKGSTTVF